MEKDAIGEKSNVISRYFNAIEPARSDGLHRFVKVFGHKIEHILKPLSQQIAVFQDKICKQWDMGSGKLCLENPGP